MRRSRKGSLVTIILYICLCCIFFSSREALAADLSVSSAKLTVYTGTSQQMKAEASAKYRGRPITWTSSKPSIGSITQKGIFKAKKTGKTVLTAQISGTGIKAKIKVTVKQNVKPKKVKITNIQKKLGIGSKLQLKAKVLPDDATSKQIIWSSSNPKTAVISSKGVVNAKAAGTTKITAKIQGTTIKKSFKLTVTKAVALKKIKITTTSKQLEVGDTLQLAAELTPKDTTFAQITWKSNDTSIAEVSDSGLVNAKKAGKVKITALQQDSKKQTTIILLVQKKHIPVTGVELIQSSGSIETGQKVQFQAQVIPSDADWHNIVWSSSDATKATVDQNGVVTALRPTERVTITAKAANTSYSVTKELQITANNGMLTKSDLDSLALTSIRKVMIVAHPDDETLWGGSHLIDGEYLVVVLTNGWNKKRVSDFNNVMNQTNEKRIILSYPDTKRDYQSGSKWTYDTDYWSTCMNGMMKDIDLILNYKNWTEVVTHNPNGEYGKYHHQKVCQMVTTCFNRSLRGRAKLYYFGTYYDAGSQIPGEQIPEDNLAIKRHLIDLYLPVAQGAITAFGHMIPYENWTQG